MQAGVQHLASVGCAASFTARLTRRILRRVFLRVLRLALVLYALLVGFVKDAAALFLTAAALEAGVFRLFRVIFTPLFAAGFLGRIRRPVTILEALLEGFARLSRALFLAPATLNTGILHVASVCLTAVLTPGVLRRIDRPVTVLQTVVIRVLGPIFASVDVAAISPARAEHI